MPRRKKKLSKKEQASSRFTEPLLADTASMTPIEKKPTPRIAQRYVAISNQDANWDCFLLNDQFYSLILFVQPVQSARTDSYYLRTLFVRKEI